MKKNFLFFAFLLSLLLYLGDSSYAQTKIDWKQIKNIPNKLHLEDVYLNHLIFNSAYQPVMDSAHQGAIYYDNQFERLRVYENGEWRDLSVSIASDSIGAPLTILGYLQATDIYASRSAYIRQGVYASGTSEFQNLKVNNALKVPTVASKTLGVGSIYYDTTAKQLKVLNPSNNWDIVSIAVDNAMSATSTNPVQNKVIYTKFDNFEASTTQQLQQTLIDAYNYANGIATQAYNYADNAANNASSSAYNAAVSYANTQILVIDGRINTLNTNLLASLTQGLTGANASATLYASSAVQISEGYAQGLATATYNAAASYTDALRTYVDRQDRLTIASASKLFVSSVDTGSASGTIGVYKDLQLIDVPVKGLGDAAFTNVASITPQPMANPPSNPYTGQMYFNTTTNSLFYWNVNEWVGFGSDEPYVVASSTSVPIRHLSQSSPGNPNVTLSAESYGTAVFELRKISRGFYRINIKLTFTLGVTNDHSYGISMYDLFLNDPSEYAKCSQILSSYWFKPSLFGAQVNHLNGGFSYNPLMNFYHDNSHNDYVVFGVYMPSTQDATSLTNAGLNIVIDYLCY